MRKLAVGCALFALPVLAAYTYLLTDNFASGINSAVWYSNGTIAGNSTVGLYSAATNGGSVINRNLSFGAGLGTDVGYEVRATLKIGASGGTFVLYSHATTDAMSGPAAQGTFYSAEFTPTLTSGGCTMAAVYYKRVGGVLTAMVNRTLACKDGMTIRWAQRAGYSAVSTSLNELEVLYDSSIGSGRPGFGARNMPSGNGISEARLGDLEYVSPDPISATSVRTALFDNRVDLAWTGVTDDVNGSGFLLYMVYRGTTFMGFVRGAYFSDTTVTAGASYTYTIYPHDVHLNYSSRAISITTPGTGMKDPRKVGVRPLGAYWGASPEQIDLQSGNLNFSLPTVTAKGRGGSAVPFRLSYNSQNWRKDPSNTWLLGTDVGFGFGWKMLAGSLTPVYSDWYTIHHYVYTDSSGAEYDLDVNSGSIWRSTKGIFVEYDSLTQRLYFPGGSYWEFGCTANGTEADAGTLYPTRLVDTNGNEIKLRYQGGLHYGGTNGSARVTEVEDVRAAAITGGYRSYQFTYNADAIPHLTSIASDIGDGAYYSFTYTAGVALADPFSSTPASFGTAAQLTTMVVPGSAGLHFTMAYQTNSQELSQVTMPYGGTLAWSYGVKELVGVRKQMEVTTRVLNSLDGAGNRTYTISHDDTGDTGRLAHSYTVVADASGVSDKAWFFYTSNDYKLGLFSSLYERAYTPAVVTKRSSVATWALTTNGNPYIGANDEVIDPGVSGVEKASRVEQTLNDHGNLMERKQYGYYTPGGTPPLVRTFTYDYLATVDYTSRHICNRLLTVKVQKPGGSLITLTTNTYDVYPFSQVDPVSNPSVLRQHDTSNYGTLFLFRGNVTRSVSPGKAVNMIYDYTGTAWKSTDDYGHQATQTSDASKNYAAPSAMTAGSSSSSFSWNGYNALTSAVGANGDTASFSYDTYARPASKTSPSGAVTTFTYGATSPYWTLATTGTRWTRSTVDGFGRTIKVESGYTVSGTSTTVSTVETKYAPCACTPVGKLWMTSLPYGPGGTAIYTENKYDALGRTVQVIQPGGTGTTSYSYAGVTVTVTDPAGKWKSYENDALGNLVKVTEPRPGGGTPYDSVYAYSELGQLLTVTMARPGKGASSGTTITQTRTWTYDSTTQRVSTVTHPESGTTTLSYNTDGTLDYKLDAKGQKLLYAYDSDGRVTSVRRFVGTTESTCAKVEYFYSSQTFDATFSTYASGRLAATRTGCTTAGAGQLIELYGYNVAGAVTKKRLRIVRSSGSVDKDVAYSYGSDGKLAAVLYPGTTVPYTYTYDGADRPIKMTGPPTLLGSTTVDHVKDVAYGAAGNVTGMKYLHWQDSGTPHYFTEQKDYNGLFQMTQQRAWSEGVVPPVVADIEYAFSTTANNGRILSRKNNARSGETFTYQYDELNRLTSATSSVGWTQSFDMDGYGNMWSQTMSSGGSATPMSVTFDMTKNRMNNSGWGFDNNGNTTTMPTSGGSATLTYDVDNRLVSWSGPAGQEDYGYLADNKRVWKKAPSGVETVYFYGAGGQKLLTYTLQASPLALVSPVENIYFGGKVIRANGVAVVSDRLGSVIARSGCGDCATVAAHEYLPYGEEMGTGTSGNVGKFGTYLRDQTTGLDYADQRYFAGTGAGRFLTPDPAGSGTNWYAYVGGDPVNFHDPTGLNESPGGANGSDDALAACYILFNTNCSLTSGGGVGSGGSGSWGDLGASSGGTTPTVTSAVTAYCVPVETCDLAATIAASFAEQQMRNQVSFPLPNFGGNGLVKEALVNSLSSTPLVAAYNYANALIDSPSTFYAGWVNMVLNDNPAGALQVGQAVATAVPVTRVAASVSPMWVAVGPGQPAGVHLAYEVNGSWYHGINDIFGNVSVTSQAAEAYVARQAWFQFPVPIINPAGVAGTVGASTPNCFTALCLGFISGWTWP